VKTASEVVRLAQNSYRDEYSSNIMSLQVSMKKSTEDRGQIQIRVCRDAFGGTIRTKDFWEPLKKRRIGTQPVRSTVGGP